MVGFEPLRWACPVFDIRGSEALRESFIVVGECLHVVKRKVSTCRRDVDSAAPAVRRLKMNPSFLRTLLYVVLDWFPAMNRCRKLSARPRVGDGVEPASAQRVEDSYPSGDLDSSDLVLACYSTTMGFGRQVLVL